MINVTKTYLPPLSRYMGLLQEVWDSGQLTNAGPLSVRLERALADWLQVPHVVLVSSGTLALQIAVKALGVSGAPVITTPFSYVATTSSLVWEGCAPVFVDVDPETLCLDSSRVSGAVNLVTRPGGILATHVYGNPCDVDALEATATALGIPLLFDAAHAFGVRHKGKSLLTYGDASVLSFHATKLFHTAEGGAVVTTRDDVAQLARQFRNFGHVTPESFDVAGINGKMSELHAAMGLAVLPDVATLIASRRRIAERYDSILKSAVERPHRRPNTVPNFAYYPILFSGLDARERVLAVLEQNGVFPRRYFSPSLNTLPYVEFTAMPVAESAADRVLCLPLYADLALADVDMIADLVLRHL